MYVYNTFYLRELVCELSVIFAPVCGVAWLELRFWYRGLPMLTSLKRYVSRGLQRVHPRVQSVLGSKSCSGCGLAYMCFPDLVFYRLDRPLAPSDPKVSTIVISKLVAKPQRKSNFFPQSGILCTRSRLVIVFTDLEFEERLWLEHVCKVCAQSTLLLRFHNYS